LYYHRIVRLASDPQLLAVTPEHFDQHLTVLRNHYNVMPLRQMAADLVIGRQPGRVVVITFDDGFEDNATEALPLLKKHDMPATFYLASGFIGTNREFLQDELERLILLPKQLPAELKICVRGAEHSWRLGSQAQTEAPDVRWNVTMPAAPLSRHSVYREIHEMLRCCSITERNQALGSLCSQCGDSGQARGTHCAMSWKQVLQAAGDALFEIGGHTVNHPWLSVLPLEEQQAEIAGCKQSIEEHIAHEVVSFAYPYGVPSSFNSDSLRALQQAGFQNACVTSRNRIAPGTDLRQIPRMCVRDWNGDRFMKELRRAQL
jgi:peptidoglycan/xylan/chitin deacetylase (PgdA/CDA1 family)